jgi:hypothetical protein
LNIGWFGSKFGLFCSGSMIFDIQSKPWIEPFALVPRVMMQIKEKFTFKEENYGLCTIENAIKE